MSGIPITAGRLASGGDLTLDLTDSWHIALQGMTRSGKSALTYTLLGHLAHRRDVIICGIDSTGILLNPWSGHPGQQFRALGSKVPAMADAMTAITTEMDARIAWLLDNDMDKMGDPTPDMPLMVVVMEEYPATLSIAESDDQYEARKPVERLAPKITRAVRRIVQEGAKANLRLLLIAQRMDASIVGGAERSNLGNRITMRVEDPHGVHMLHPTATPEWVEMVSRFTPGVGLIDRPGHPTGMFKADLITYRQYVNHVRKHAA